LFKNKTKTIDGVLSTGSFFRLTPKEQEQDNFTLIRLQTFRKLKQKNHKQK